VIPIRIKDITIIERPSAPSFHLPMKKQHKHESKAVPPMISQRTSVKVYLIDSKIFALGGVGLMFSPKTFFLRFKSFSSPTIPVFFSEANFFKIPAVPP